MNSTNWILSTLVLLIGAEQSWATTYYVKNGGSDNADGLSDATAWATLAKVGLRAYGPGDVILLKRGSTWNEELVLQGSGTAASKITLRDYGSGALPKIQRSSQSYAAGDVCITLDSEHDWIIQSIRVENAYRGIDLRSQSVGVVVDGCYFKDMDDRNATFPNYSAGLHAFGADHLTITSCTFDTTTSGADVVATNFLLIDGCEAFGGWSAGFALHAVDDGLVSNFNVHDVGGNMPIGTCGGFIVNSNRVDITDCTFARVTRNGTPDGVGFDFESSNVDCTLTRSYFYENDGAAILMFSPVVNGENQNITISDCLFYDNNKDPQGSSQADCNLFAAVNPGCRLSTGQIINCGSYINANSVNHFSSNWNQFTITGMIEGTQCPRWTPVYGNLAQISVGGNGHIWGVDGNNAVLMWTGGYLGDCWRHVSAPGPMRSVSVGDDGEAWGVQTDDTVWRYAGNGAWTSMGVSFKQVSVGSASNIWAIKNTGRIYRWSAPNWMNIAGTLTDIDAGPLATDYAWGVDGSVVYRYDGSSWVQNNQVLTQISASTYDIATGVNGTSIYRTVNGGSTWTLHAGALKQVSQGSDGTWWGVDTRNMVWRH